MSTIIVGLIVLALVALAVHSMWKNHKAGQCSGGCAGCSGACQGCQPHHK